MDTQDTQALRNLPSVDFILKDPQLVSVISELGREPVAQAVRQAADALRAWLLNDAGAPADREDLHQRIIDMSLASLAAFQKPFYGRVVNATGIILHTALGRAVLAPKVLEEIQEELTGYSRLQVDLFTGKRARRDEGVEQLLKQLTGAEAATVVNNNAAATALVLNTVARGREVIVSRGQLVEIGGAFRLPEVMAFSGARLVEVGTTNKTHARDYENAITENTAAILRVHPSNFKIQGFTSEVPLETLVQIAHDHGLVLIDDVGAGSLLDMSRFGFDPEPTLPESIAAGSDLVTSSADKLIGASQGGIILGRSDLIAAVRKNQFARIVRVGKLTLAALEATLKLFMDPTLAQQHLPTLAMIVRDPDDLKAAAARIAEQLGTLKQVEITTQSGFSQTGSGSLPTQNLPTTLVTVNPTAVSTRDLAQRLRQYRTPVFTRIQNDQILIDPRTLQADDDVLVVDALKSILDF